MLIRKLTILTLVLVLQGFAGCTYLGEPSPEPVPGNSYTETPDYISIYSTISSASVRWGFLYYPGALVDPHAYAGWISQLVDDQRDMQAIIVKEPANLAVFNADKGLKIMEEFPNIQRWIIAGHSLGGAMACRVVDKHPDTFEAMVLLAAYPPNSNDLAEWQGTAISVYGSLDGLATPDKVNAREDIMPEPYIMNRIDDFPAVLQNKTLYYEMQGGNHSQFGNYGTQKGDNQATITEAVQQDTLVTLIRGLINELD